MWILIVHFGRVKRVTATIHINKRLALTVKEDNSHLSSRIVGAFTATTAYLFTHLITRETICPRENRKNKILSATIIELQDMYPKYHSAV